MGITTQIGEIPAQTASLALLRQEARMEVSIALSTEQLIASAVKLVRAVPTLPR
jgi:hypothetical protein